MNDFKNINDWEVLTPTGWSNIDGINHLKKCSFVRILFSDGTKLECSENHKLKLLNEKFVSSNCIKKGMVLLGNDFKNKTVVSKRKIKKKIDLYDLINVEKHQEFYSNDIISHNCAFIDGVDEIWTAAYPTLSTGGKSIILSTPNGVGNFFHKMWKDAEEKKLTATKPFNQIKLPWHLHPERDQNWRDQQTEVAKTPKEAAQECDCSFLTSGATLVDLSIVEWYKENVQRDPVECRGVDRAEWIWEYPDYSRTYIVSGDVARGDGTDYSTYHVLDAETLNQCAEYKGQIGTTEFGHMLVNIATIYNKALLIVENTGIGWAPLQVVIDSGYPNTFYSTLDLKYVEVQRQLITKFYSEEKKMVPGFSTTLKTRPLIISRLEQYFRDKAVNIYSSRMIGELETFIWDKGKVVAMSGYNDDLCMALGIGLWVRDTALRLKQQSQEYSRAMVDKIGKSEYTGSTAVFTNKNQSSGYESWNMRIGKQNQTENLTWLL